MGNPDYHPKAEGTGLSGLDLYLLLLLSLSRRSCHAALSSFFQAWRDVPSSRKPSQLPLLLPGLAQTWESTGPVQGYEHLDGGGYVPGPACTALGLQGGIAYLNHRGLEDMNPVSRATWGKITAPLQALSPQPSSGGNGLPNPDCEGETRGEHPEQHRAGTE